MYPNGYNEGCEVNIRAAEPPMIPLHELLAKMSAISEDLKANARYIDSSMFPVNDRNSEVCKPDGVLNIYDHLKSIANELVEANDILIRIRERL